MVFGGNFRAAFKALLVNGTRSFLTILGVIIGVAAVIASVTLTEGVSASINQRFAQLGTDTLSVMPGATASTGGIVTGGLGTASSLTLGDAAAIATLSHVTAVSPELSITGKVVYKNQNWQPQVFGVYPGYQTIKNVRVDEGSWFSDADEQAKAAKAVLGATVVSHLFGTTGEDPIGKSIMINGQIFTIVGTLQSQGGFQDNNVFLPLSTVQQRLSNTSPSAIDVLVDNVNNVDQVQREITSLLEERHHLPDTGGQGGSSDDFQVTSPKTFVQNAQASAATLASLLISIAAVSLTVGGIGIMNIMLVSVTERTREIGVRMAVGARKSDIRNQFLIEAVALSAIGGMLGILLGLLVGYELVSGSQLPLVIDSLVILLAVGVAAFIGIVFGLYPAIRASELDPITALRVE